MATLLTLGVGFSDAPDKVQPTLNDCLVAVIEHAESLMEEVLDGLLLARQPTGSRSNPALQEGSTRRAVDHLLRKTGEVCADFRGELSRIVYEGGAAQAPSASVLRYEDLQLLEGPDLERSIEVARAQQELLLAVEDVLPPLDACVSTLLGWRTIQPELNPLRPDVFVRALQAVLSWHVPDDAAREALITPAAGLMGANLRKIYRELGDWLRHSGVESAVPAAGLVHRRGQEKGMAARGSLARTLVTLDRLRLLLSGGLHQAAAADPRSDFLHTVPASMALLQERNQLDSFVTRMTQRGRTGDGGGAGDPAAQARLGRRIGEEVVRQMFENLQQDARLLPGYLSRLRKIEPAVVRLARHDSRFFSDAQHPARRLLDQLTQRSLGFKTDTDEGCARFLATAETAVRWLEVEAIDADVFQELLEYLQAQWARQDRQVHEGQEKEALVLLQAEQRNLLIGACAAEFAEACQRRPVPPFVADLLLHTWPRVVAQARLGSQDGSKDPGGYHELARELIWSVQKKKNPPPARTRRLAVMIPGLLTRLRSGLASIDHPPAQTEQLFDQLITVHQAALQEGREASPQSGAALAEDDDVVDAAVQWLTDNDSVDPRCMAEAAAAQRCAGPDSLGGDSASPAAGAGELRPGAWVDLMVDGQWLRVQLTWASPGATLFMFISPAGTSHSMSRRTLERLRLQGLMRVVAHRSPVQEALDGVATAALANTFAPRT